MRVCSVLGGICAAVVVLSGCATTQSDGSALSATRPADVFLADENCPTRLDDLPALATAFGAPSDKTPIPVQQLLHVSPNQLSGDSVYLGDIATALQNALFREGYPAYSYHGLGCDGFALLANIERISEDATPFAEPDRWATPESFDPSREHSYWLRLFYSPPGFYRQIAFVVSKDSLDDLVAGETISSTEFDSHIETGASALGQNMSYLPFTHQYRIMVLVYEFEKGARPDARPPEIQMASAGVHLVRSGLRDRFNEGRALEPGL